MEKRGELSIARREQGKLGSVSQLALTAALGFAALPAFSTEGWAACDPIGGIQFVCSGVNTTSQIIDSPGAQVTTTPGFSVDTTTGGGGGALRISGNGPQSYIDMNGSLLTGSGLDPGLAVVSSGAAAGQVTILTNGSISGYYGISGYTDGVGAATNISAFGYVTGQAIGISASNGGFSGDISVVATTVSGQSRGIDVRNYGVGEARILATGMVEGTVNGIFAVTRGTDVAVTTAGVLGGDTGVMASNLGTGATSIIATGTVTGTEEYGVVAYNAPTALGGLSVLTADVSGGSAGIIAANSGAGATGITAGHVSGGIGVIATNGVVDPSDFLSNPALTALTGGANAAATDLNIAVASVDASQSGIIARNNGTGATTITATGLVEGTGTDGIVVVNGSTATNLTVEATDVRGGSYGITASNGGTGATRIATTGLVEGAHAGINAFNSGSAAGLTIEAAGTLGGNNGIRALNYGTGSTWIMATGAVEGTGGTGILAQNGADAGHMTIETAAVTGGRNGILALNDGIGVTTIMASGLVTGTTGDGVFAYNGETTPGGLSVHMADVTGGRAGIAAANSGAGATLITAGHVSGGSFGIVATNRVVDPFDFEDDPFGSTLNSGGVNAAATSLTVQVASVYAAQIGLVAVNNGTGATTITATGLVEGTDADGIFVENRRTATNLTVEATDVRGGGYGIFATNYGTGATRIATTGLVEGANAGIYAANAGSASSLEIDAASITGGTYGIFAVNSGTGATWIMASGTVEGTSGTGIYAYNGADATHMTIETAAVTSARDGIFALNEGTGATAIMAEGAVVGTGHYGVLAYSGPTTLGGLAVHMTDVTGGLVGIAAANSGAGATLVTASHVSSDGYGIVATNGVVDPLFRSDPIGAAQSGSPNAAATDLTIQVANVTAAQGGILAVNDGTGASRINVSDMVESASGTGIIAINNSTATDQMIEAARVRGAVHGIGAVNLGTGVTSIAASGPVTSTISDGVFAYNGETTLGGLSVRMADVTGGRAGVAVANSGAGATLITAGHVSGSDGIIATNGLVSFADFAADPFATALTAGVNGQAGDLTVEAESVTATRYGIVAANYGVGATRITTTGLVEGGAAAISAFSAGGPISIDSSGLIRNLSQLSAGAAVIGSGGPIAFTNGGGMVGTVQFGAGAHTMMNNAAWNTAGGANEFGGGQLTNAAGIVITAAENGGAAETTLFNGLGTFANHGILSMADGGAGDVTRQAGGSARFEAGSVLAVDIDETGRSDHFITSGTATLTGATLAVSPAGIMPAYGTRYTVLTADAGLSGQFASVTGLPAQTAFLTIDDTYDANNAYLDVIKYRTFASAGLTPNQIATAGGLDSMLPGPVVNAVAALGTDAQAQHAFGQLSGEVHASARTVMIEDSRFLRSAVNDRLRAAFDGVGSVAMPVMAYADGGPRYVPGTTDRFAVWGQAFGSWGHWNGDGNAARLNRSIGGFFIGADAPVFDTWRFGAVAGYSRSSFNARDRASSGSSDNYHVGLYGGTAWGDLAFRTGAAYTWHDFTTNRSVIFPGYGDSLKGKYDAATAQVFGELAYGFSTGNARFEPLANLAYVNLRTDGFTERGGAAALTSPSANTDATFTTLGLRASTTFNLGEAAVTAKGMLGWRHAFGNVSPDATMRFASGSDAFSIGGIPIARNSAVVEAGLDFNLSPSAVLGVSYGGQFGSGITDQTFRANFNIKF